VRGFTLLLTLLMLSVAAPVAAHAQQPAGGTEPPADPNTNTQQPPQDAPHTGGTAYGEDPAAPPRAYVPGTVAVLQPTGFAAAPADAPVEVQEAVFAANEIVGKPYSYGGGHRSFKSVGYDCSGTVSYALHGGGLLKSPLDSSSFMRWGDKGPGTWITVYTNPGHAYVIIAGLRLDTSSAGDRVSTGRGPRWRTTARKFRGYRVRHPVGF
jgi:cell wall-associated NlpC family hydrolase